MTELAAGDTTTTQNLGRTMTQAGQETRTGRGKATGEGKPKRPALTRLDAATCQCGARWTGTSKCHCSAKGCHRLFSSVSMFDRHRVNGSCVAPETIMITSRTDKSQRPAFVLREGVWCSADEFDMDILGGAS